MESKRVSKTQFKARVLEYLRTVENTGTTVVVTDHGRPTVEIRRYRPAEYDPLDALRGSVVRYNFPTEPLATRDWESSR